MPVAVVAVIPVGPHCRAEFVRDTIESLLLVAPDARVIVVDDSGRDTGRLAMPERGLAGIASTTVLTTAAPGDEPAGKVGGLYLTLSTGFREALTRPFDILLRIDTDALVTGEQFIQSASDTFTSNPPLSVLGSFKDSGGDVGHTARRAIRRRLFNPRYVVRNPRRALQLWRLATRARVRGYPLGSYVFGGICVYSAAGIRRLDDNGLLGHPPFAGLHLSEDHLFGLLITGSGGDLGELRHNGSTMMGIRWKQLPDSPPQLVASGRELVHSVRHWENLDEAAVRAQFRALRRGR